MTRTTIATAVTTTALAAALLSGCGSGGQPAASSSSMPNVEPPRSSSSAAPVPATSSPTPSTSSRSVEMAGAPGVPKPARMHTKAGSAAFVQYYVRLINQTGIKPRAGRLEPLATQSCDSCGNHASNVRALRASDQHYSGALFDVVETASAKRGHGSMDVFADTVQQPTEIVNSNGAAVDSISRDRATLVFRLDWTTGGWRVSEIEVANYGTRSQ